MDIEILYWFALAFRSGLGAADVRRLVRFWREKTRLPLADLFRIGPFAWKSFGFDETQEKALLRARQSLPDAFRELDPCRIARISALTARDSLYPKKLADTMGRICPTLLFHAGNPQLWNAPVVSLLGARKPTEAGLDFARETAAFLARAGVTIVTGYAEETNRAALAAALEAGGKAALFLAQGSLTLGNEGDDLGPHVDGGRLLVASACAPRAPSTPARIAQRDALITALSDETVVCEVGSPSGATWEAARTALRQHKQVWARRDVNSDRIHAGLAELGAQFVPCRGAEWEEWRGALAQRALESRENPRTESSGADTGREISERTDTEPMLFPDLNEFCRSTGPDGHPRRSPMPRLSDPVGWDILEFALRKRKEEENR